MAGTVVSADERPSLRADTWRERLVELMVEHRVPGATLGILDRGQIDVVAAGVASKRTAVEVTPDTVFQIGSITKVWTATLALQLVDEGRLELDAPVRVVLPELRLGDSHVAQAVTMRHLLAHTSGIDGDVFTDTGRGDDCLERYVAGLAGVAQNQPLGAAWSYCNAGYVLAGRVIEVLTGLTWDQALRERLVEPLGLAQTVTLPEDALLHRAAVGHVGEPDEEPVPVATWGLPRAMGPAGLVTASAHDVLAFARLHLDDGRTPDGGRLLSSASARAMRACEATLPEPYTLGDSWGLGWIRFAWAGERVVGHDGNTIGQSAFLRVLPEHGLAVCLLTNGGNATDLFRQVLPELVAAVGAEVPPPLEPRPGVVVDPRPLLGRYERTGVTTEVFVEDGVARLRSTVTGPLAERFPEPVHTYELVPVEPGLFAIRPPGARTWAAVAFTSVDGRRYVHYGARSSPLVASA